MLSSLTQLPRFAKTLLVVVHDALLAAAAVWLSVLFRAGSIASVNMTHLLIVTALVGVMVPAAAALLGYYRMVLRFHSPVLILKTALLVGICGAILIVLGLVGGAPAMRSVGLGVVFALTLFSLLTLSRLVARWMMNGFSFKDGSRVPVAIYGAGSAGRQLASMIRSAPEYAAVLFLDDDATLQGRVIEGIRVLDPKDQKLLQRLNSHGVKQILLAMPGLSGGRRREILQYLGQFPFQIRSVPALPQLLGGQIRLNELREISIEDVLGREPVPPLAGLLERCIADKCVLVTGGGGSIGAELCRQVLMLRPQRLIVLDHSEFALYSIEQELRAMADQLPRPPQLGFCLGSVTNRTWLQSVFAQARIDTVYHAAAYKHVPMVEANAAEGLRNNALGTWTVADLAAQAGVRHFVLISTDKAVRPTSVMGATKRVAELIVQAYSELHPSCIFSMVRFGNVLGSSGSIVPLFRSQIEKGGPLTLTHPDVTRYFMTIPEAVQLVIQAGAMAAGGEVFILDMGEPVKIGDLAQKMIRLSGLSVRSAESPDGDIAIEVIGLRPGEKLFEELLLSDNAAGTSHPRIWCAKEARIPWSELESDLRRFQRQEGVSEGDVCTLLERWVAGYTAPSAVLAPAA